MSYKDLFKKYKKHGKRGMTLVEIIVTIAIISITSGAMLSVFVMVHEVTQDASDITVQQLTTGQTEKLIRNEMQVASRVDIKKASLLVNGSAKALDAKIGDSYMAYSETEGRLSFYRCEVDGKYTELFTVDNVQKAQISIAPMNDLVSDKSGQHYKLFYEISTDKYDYSGGMVLSNTEVLNNKVPCFVEAGSPASAHTILWKDGGNNYAGNILYNNDNYTGSYYGNEYAITFHREQASYTH